MIPHRLKQRIPWRLRLLGERLQRRVEDAALALVTRQVPLPASVRSRRVTLIGASVGRDWRLRLVFPNMRTVAAFQYDKSELVARAAADRPDGVIIKQCAAYFPDDRPELHLVEGWVEELRGRGVRVALATVAPVTREHARQAPGRAEGLWRYNDAVRRLADEQAIPLLDLEGALCVSPDDRHLDDDLHGGDGLHLSRQTYRRRLDPLIPPLLLRMFSHG